MTSNLCKLTRDPLLAPAEELELARVIQLGMEENASEIQIRRADKAKQRMVSGNTRLALNIAKRYYQRCKHLDLEDLTQEAILGLHRATEKFDPQRGYKFSTYAYYWIEQSIRRAINNLDAEIRVPVHCTDQVTRYKTAYAANRFLSRDEVAKIAKVNVDFLELAARAKNICSLNKALLGKENEELMGLVATEPQDEDSMLQNLCLDIEDLNKALCRLPEKDATVLRLYYGLNGGERIGMERIAKRIGLSKEGVRMARDRAHLLLRRELILAQAYPTLHSSKNG